MGLQKFLPLIQSLLVLAARSFGDLSSWHWNPRLGGLASGWDSLLPRYPSRVFIHHMCVRDQPVTHLHPPTSLDGCGFFNSIVVRLPFNLISICSMQWWFYILVAVLMRLYKETSYVCHLDQQSVLCLYKHLLKTLGPG